MYTPSLVTTKKFSLDVMTSVYNESLCAGVALRKCCALCVVRVARAARELQVLAPGTRATESAARRAFALGV